MDEAPAPRGLVIFPAMRHLALTGNIAAGKSTVAALLAAKGATLIDADQLAREAIAPGTPGFDAVVEHFGPTVVAPDGQIDRSALRRRVFGDAAARDVLNGIVHPIVARLREAAVREARARGDALVISDIPLLFEVGLERAFDGVVLVDAPEAVRRARMVRDRGLSVEEADAMIAAQWPSARKRAGATWILENGGTRGQLARQVEALWPVLLAADGAATPLPHGASAADTSPR
jgi:dephospho-CoA kinase